LTDVTWTAIRRKLAWQIASLDSLPGSAVKYCPHGQPEFYAATERGRGEDRLQNVKGFAIMFFTDDSRVIENRAPLLITAARRALFAWLVTLLMASSWVFAQDVRYNFDKDTDFSKFKTYKWVVIKGATQPDDLVDKQIKEAFDAQLATKGLSKVEGDDANLLVGYQTAIGTEKQFTSFSSGMGGPGWGYGPGWYGGGWYGGGGMTTTSGSTSTIYKGQLALDMYDSAHHDLVWRGVASKTLDPKAKPDKREKNLNKAVAKLMKNYPPKAK
jgi:hypothetical protein